MGIFNMFSNHKSSDERSNFPWIALNDNLQLEEIQQNKSEIILIFKHSTRCGISNSALSRFERKYLEQKSSYKFYYLDLLNYRELSAEIAEYFKVIHQSPQLIVVREGVVKVHASHYDILDLDIMSRVYCGGCLAYKEQ